MAEEKLNFASFYTIYQVIARLVKEYHNAAYRLFAVVEQGNYIFRLCSAVFDVVGKTQIKFYLLVQLSFLVMNPLPPLATV